MFNYAIQAMRRAIKPYAFRSEMGMFRTEKDFFFCIFSTAEL